MGYSTHFTFFFPGIPAEAAPNAITVDAYGSATIAGQASLGLPTTPGAYQTACLCTGEGPIPGIGIGPVVFGVGFVTRFETDASNLIYSTYLPSFAVSSLAVGPDGSAYAASRANIYRLDAAGSTLLATSVTPVLIDAMALAPDGSVYLAGGPDNLFHATQGAFRSTLNYQRGALYAIVRLDAQLQTILAGTYFFGAGISSSVVSSLALDASGNLYLGGRTSGGLPTRTPMFIGFGDGFLSELSGDLSALLFSSTFGADRNFSVQGVTVGANGTIVIGGVDVQNALIVPQPGNVWLNSLTLTAPPALRIDSIGNAASLIEGPISTGETIVVNGAGFGSDTQLVIGGMTAPLIQVNPGTITATVPPGLSGPYAVAQVASGGAVSNQVVIQTAASSPGLFSLSLGGYGQAFILNSDGTPNTPSTPAAPGDRITVFATGVGPVSFTDGYAVSQFPSNLFIGGVYCDGVAAYMGPVSGLPGSVYRLTVHVPNPANSTLPAQSSVALQMNGVDSQDGLVISIAQ